MHYAGGPVVRWPEGGDGLQRGPFALDQGSHRLISLKGAPAGDQVLIGALSTSKELSFLHQASCVYQENSLRRLHIVVQKIFSVASGTPFALDHGPEVVKFIDFV